ncbi:p20 [Scheffersomyces spartinae]|uniref:Cap-associated protein CAF20 n=1 Tax=Scheffersomyces spartinae TaxID=45513 RepID=A0A9P8AG30_9ASCO|nr:p20 [Scheffersomyces spartinae]KAG7191723.1 p20 [Scheffersomyces spartinae]
MAKYSEEQLLAIKEEAHVPQEEVLAAFNQLVDEVKAHAAAEAEKYRLSKRTNGDSYLDEHGVERSYHHLNRRRPSRTGNKPNLRKKSVDAIQVDQDGWATMTKQRKSFNGEQDDERKKFQDSVKDISGMKMKPNNKNLGSSKAADPRDVLADRHANAFNAFLALGDDDDD